MEKVVNLTKWKNPKSGKLNFNAITFILLTIFICNEFNTFGQNRKTDSIDTYFIYLIDGHCHQGFTSLKPKSISSEISFLKVRDFNAINLPLPINKSATNNLVEQIEYETKQLDLLSSQVKNYQLSCKSGNCMHDIEKINVFFSIEYFQGVFNNDVACISEYKKLGIQYITLINNKYDVLFQHNTSKLTPFGEKVISEMNHQAVTIDVAHLTNNQRLTVINKSWRPVIISHRNCLTITNSSQNVSDEVLQALIRKNGLLLLNFSTIGVFEDKKDTDNAIEQLAKHLIHAKEIIGIDNIGFGSDMQEYGKYIPHHLSKPEGMSHLINYLLNKGFSKEDINKLAYKNYLRFFS